MAQQFPDEPLAAARHAQAPFHTTVPGAVWVFLGVWEVVEARDLQ
jgi:hypothetical protein